MATFHERSVTRARKQYQCEWCGELVEKGSPYRSYRWAEDGDAGTVRLHPECSAAMGVEIKAQGGHIMWLAGDYARGSRDGRACG